MEPIRDRANRTTLGLSLALSLLLGSCGPAAEEVDRPNVVVLVVDTLRADRLPPYGGPDENAPFLAKLAERSLVFENAWSPSSWTLPAALSVLTSLHPFQHGITSLEGLELGPDDEKVPVNVIPDDVDTMAEVLSSQGYRTFGLVSNILMGEEIGLGDRFDRFLRLDDEDASVVQEQLQEWMVELHDSEPYFLYLHYFDPHDPLHAREPWFEQRLGRPGPSWPRGEYPADSEAAANLGWFRGRLRPAPPELEGRNVEDLEPEELAGLLTWIRAAYDSEIRYVDEAIAQTWEALGLDDALVVFLADHGEEFYEHGQLTHGFNLHVETTRVPLMLYTGQPEDHARVAHHVNTLDVLPTIREMLGLPPSFRDQGTSLLAASTRAPVLSFLPGNADPFSPEEDQFAVTSGRFRLLFSADGAASAPKLFDLETDPGEQNDLAASLPDQVDALLAHFRERMDTAPRIPRVLRVPGTIHEGIGEHLEGLGYLGN